jgi:hypothetical protein
MIVSLLYSQFETGLDEIDHEKKTWRGLFVFVAIGYLPLIAVAGLKCVLEASKSFF